MTTLCCPAVAVPEHVITLDDTLKIAADIHRNHDQLPLILRLIANTEVKKRHLIQPIEDALLHPGFELRNRLYEKEAKSRIPDVVDEAINNADITPAEIDLIIYVSCTGFMMPSMTAWMINNLGFKYSTKQLPIAQLGCAGGSAAINRAFDYCSAWPGSNVLIVACEFCSLCYQPTDISVGNLLSNGLFGDAVAAVVVRGDDVYGVNLQGSGSRIVPDTENWISYAVKDTGFHFCLDKRVPKTMEQLAPELKSVANDFGWDASGLDFYVIHAGGPRILDDLSCFLNVEKEKFSFSRSTLHEYGNVASVVVLDALRRMFISGYDVNNARGIIAGFGPGITAEISVGYWFCS